MSKLLQKLVSVAVGFMSAPLIIFSRFSPVTIPKLQLICYLFSAFVLQGFTVFLVFWLLDIDYPLISPEVYNHVNHYVSAMGDYTYTISSPLSNPAHGPESGFFTGNMSNVNIYPLFYNLPNDPFFAFVSYLFEHISDYNDSFFNSVGPDKGLSNLYNQYYWFMSSLIPGSFPPLPDRPPMAFAKLVLMFVVFFIKTAIIVRAFIMIYLIYQLFCYIILIYYPNLVINYLFYFAKNARFVWVPFFTLFTGLRETVNKDDLIKSYKNLRLLMIKQYFKAIFSNAFSIVMLCCILAIFAYNGFG